MTKNTLSAPKNLKSKTGNPPLRVLIVEDSEDDALLEIRELKKGGYNPMYERVETAASMKKALKEKQWDIILCDYKLPKFNATSAIAMLKETNINIPLIIVSGTIGEEAAVECMRLGAHDYIMKNNLSRLCSAIARELKDTETRSKHKQMAAALQQSEEKYRLTFASTSDVIFTLDSELKVSNVTPSVEKILGYKPEELINKFFPDLNLITPESLERAIPNVRRVLSGAEIPNMVYNFITKEGLTRIGEVTGSSIVQEGKIIGISCVARDITERVRAESQRETALEALRRSEEKYRTILEDMEEGYFEVNLAGDFTFVNDAECRNTGTPREQLLGKNNRAYTSEEEAKKLYQLFSGIYRTGEPVKGFAFEVKRRDGTMAFNEMSASLIRNLEGKPIGFRGISRDVTERKRAEEALRQSEGKYRTIIETIQEGYFEIDLAGNFTFVNDAQCKITGTPREQLLGKNNRDYTSEEEAKRLYQIYSRIYRTGEPEKGYAFEFTRRDGTKAFHEVSASLVRDAEGKPIGFRGISRDVTERKQAEETLRQSEEKYRTILEEMEDGYFETDLSGKFTFVNDAECRNLGYTYEELIGMNSRQYADEKNAKALYRLFVEVYKTGVSVKAYNLELIKKGGTKSYDEISVSLIRNSGGEPTGFRGIARNITERREAEEALQKIDHTYRLLAEHMTDIVWMMDMGLNVTWLSPSASKTRGFSLDEIAALPLDKQLTPESLKRAVNWLGKLMRLEKDGLVSEPAGTLSRELEFYCKDGRTIVLDCTFQFVRDEQGKATGILAEGRDITALRESEERYKALFDRSLDLVYINDFEGRFIDANAAALNRLGYTKEEILSLNFASLLSEDQLPLAVKTIQEMRETGIQMGLMEFKLRHKNGSDVYVETRGSIIISNGTPVAIQAIARDITERKRAEEERKQSFERLRKALNATVHAISIAVEMKDPYTSGHQRRVSDLARSIATEMGLSADRRDFIRTASTIHDIGKIAIPTEILSKPTKLTDLEFSLIKTHAQSGYDILKDIEFPWPVADVVLQHHERIDGSGYPHGLKGDDIILEARILAIADVVEAISSHRPYRPALGINLALEEISRNKGILYDADAVDACLRLFQEKSYQLP